MLHRATPPQHRKDGKHVRARAPKRTPRLSEAEKREARRKRFARVTGVDPSALSDAGRESPGLDAEYQRLADDEVKRAAEVVRSTPRDTARRAKEARADRARGRRR